MSPAEFILHLEQHQVRLQAENGQLRFFAKPGALTPELRAAIVAQKAALLAHLLSNAGTETSARPPAPPTIQPVSRSQPLPLSSAQERLWFLDQLEGASATYNVYDAWRLNGDLNIAILKQAIQTLAQRHESLRTTFVASDSLPVVQRIHASVTVPFELIEAPGSSTEARFASALRSAEEAIRLPFALAQGPLLRVRLIKFSHQEHLLVFVVHHIIFDGWSAGILRRELEQLYSAALQGTPLELPALAIQYADFASWESNFLIGAELERKLAFWRNYLAGAPGVLELPADFSHPAVQTYRGDHTRAVIPSDLVRSLRELGRRERSTLFHVAMAAWKILLRRYTGQTDLLVGTSVSNRKQVELESVVGFFVNTLPLRTRLDGDITVRESVRQVQTSALEALAHDELPFERLVQALNPKRSLGVAPIFQVGLSFLQEGGTAHRFHDLEITPVQLDSRTAKFDMTLWLTESGDTLRASLEYATDLFTRERAERMLAHYVRLLQAMVEQPDTAITRLPMLAEAEQKLILHDWNATSVRYPQDKRLHELFEEQVRRQPNAPALVFGEETLSYNELNRRADHLAAVLRGLGVGPDVLVGLCVERTFDMVVGVLGILKSGGAYVPIDPAYPPDRIAFVLEDSNAPVLVTQRPLLASLPSVAATKVLLDEPLPAPKTKPTAAKIPSPTDLAYVLYTSGSTGQPKGVQIQHQAVVNFLQSMRREPGLTVQDTLLAVTTLSFDIAGLELHLPLSTGAKIILAPWEMAMDGDALLAAIKIHHVTMLQATPATWRLMLAAGWTKTPHLKALCGGEAMPADLAAELIPRCAEVWNMYGPTETTIWSTCTRITNPLDIHIGRAIDNTEIYILDANYQPLPIGVSGELLIGGDGLARGYLNRTELTADRFISHPFKPGQKLYRTGDLARWRPDGNIDCLGRLDFQVKIRGFRIELGEIETQLGTHPAVKQVVVSVREDTPGEKQLVAYLIAVPGAAPTEAGLREHLRGKLPHYMVPAAFITLPKFPLTPNGKIDRKALPAPGVSLTTRAPFPVAPRNETEKRLTAIFSQVLGRTPSSVQDSFFDLGGHSLLAVKLMAAIKREFGISLPLARLFEAPNIEKLALLLAQHDGSESHWNSLVPIRPKPGKPNLFLVHGAGGNVLLYREIAEAIGPDTSVYGFQSQGLDKRARPLRTIEEMAAHYVKELLNFQPHGPYHLGGYCMGGSVAFEMARLLRAQDRSVGLVALLDSYNLITVKRSGRSNKGFKRFRQKISFHLGNLAHLKTRDLPGYLGEKGRMAIELARASLSARFSKIRSSQHNGTDEKGAEVMIQAINDQAVWEFDPNPVAGIITVFRPKKNYDFMPDQHLGWAGVAPDGIDLITLPVNPHALLINPCATQVAYEMAVRIRQQSLASSLSGTPDSAKLGTAN